MKYQLGDIIVSGSKKTLSPGGWLGWGIRLFTTSPGESLSRATHVARVMVGAELLKDCLVVEAVASGVKLQKFGKPYKCVVYRARDLTSAESDCLHREALKLKGTRYGYVRIVAHALDWIKTAGKLDSFWFRRKVKGGNLAGRECSNVVAWLWSKCRGKFFGVPAYAASPDDIDDYCYQNPEKYEIVRWWGRYKGKIED